MMKTSIKRVMSASDKETAVAELQKASSVMDKMVAKGIVHRNNAANHKSRLAKWINKNFAS
jgi:small subunit ribosomal protein S20